MAVIAVAVIAVAVAVLIGERRSRQVTLPGVGGARTPAPVTSRVGSGRPTLWVLAVGVSEYDEPDLRLRFAAADARAVAEALARQRGGPLYDAVKTTNLVDADVSRASILRALDGFLGAAAPIDVGVIYLAGHGVRDDTLGGYYFLTAAASVDKPGIEGLDMDEFNRQLRLLHRNLRRLVVIVDTCHAGAVADPSQRVRVGEDLATRLPPADGLYVLAAAGSGERSQELVALGHGAFTRALLNGLEGAAANPDGVISVLGLAGYVARAVPQLTENRQTPYLSIVGEDLLLAAQPQRFAEVTPPPLPTPAAIAAPLAERERIAVMRFENLRADPQHNWMEQALGEQLATTLHQLARFDVYDESMVRFLARGATDPIEASRRADMSKLVSGTYWVQDDSISITAHVKSTNPLKSVASARIDGPLQQLSELSSQIVITLVQQMDVQLSPPEIEQLVRRSATDVAARKLLFEAERPGSGRVAPSRSPGADADPRASLRTWLVGLVTARTSYAADRAGPEAELRATLEGYRQAFEREDIAGLRGYYAEFTDDQEAALQRYFDNADDLRVEFRDVRIAMIGDRAAVAFSREDHFVDHRTGEAQQVVARVTRLFAKGAAGWLIVPEQ